MYIYEASSIGYPVYTVKDSFIYEGTGGYPIFQIKDNYIYRCSDGYLAYKVKANYIYEGSGSRIFYRIDKNYVYKCLEACPSFYIDDSSTSRTNMKKSSSEDSYSKQLCNYNNAENGDFLEIIIFIVVCLFGGLASIMIWPAMLSNIQEYILEGDVMSVVMTALLIITSIYIPIKQRDEIKKAFISGLAISAFYNFLIIMGVNIVICLIQPGNEITGFWDFVKLSVEIGIICSLAVFIPVCVLKLINWLIS